MCGGQGLRSWLKFSVSAESRVVGNDGRRKEKGGRGCGVSG